MASIGPHARAGLAAVCIALFSSAAVLAAPTIRADEDRADKDTGRADKGRFELVTYNVAGLPEGISRSRPLANLPLIGKLLNRYDVALVQEDFAYPFELRRELGLAHSSAPFVRGDQLHFGDGLSQFARLPFTDFRRVEWQACHGLVDSFFDCLTPKGFTVARQAIGEGAFVRVVNLHMDAGWSALDRAARDAQIKQLSAALSELPSGDPVIVAGDTNILRDERDLLRPLLKQSAFVDSCAELGCSQPWRIDRVLYRSSRALRLRARQWRIAREFVDADGRPLSDHEAIVVAFDWQRREPAARAAPLQARSDQ
jgi:endonuclease/exonuclease/phosphatase family metal-dependent hydrolase